MSDPERAKDFTVKDAGGDPRALPRIDFSTFTLSLAASAMVHLGLAPDPDGAASQTDERDARTPADLALARQTIDTLEMLQDKTRGNLGDDEAKLLQSVLYELRMAYVKAKDAAVQGSAS
jgi:hypothetical protein